MEHAEQSKEWYGTLLPQVKSLELTMQVSWFAHVDTKFCKSVTLYHVTNEEIEASAGYLCSKKCFSVAPIVSGITSFTAQNPREMS